jgi:hypothetical protein
MDYEIEFRIQKTVDRRKNMKTIKKLWKSFIKWAQTETDWTGPCSLPHCPDPPPPPRPVLEELQRLRELENNYNMITNLFMCNAALGKNEFSFAQELIRETEEIKRMQHLRHLQETIDWQRERIKILENK